MNKNKKISKNKAFFQIMAKYYSKEWKISLAMMIFIVMITISVIMIPLMANQITISIQKEAYEAKGGSQEEIKALEQVFWGLHWKWCILISIGAIMLDGISSYFFNLVGYLMAKKIEIGLRNRTLERLVRQDISYFSDKKIGEILTNVVSDTQIVGDASVNIPMTIGVSIFQVLAAIIMTFIFDWRIALVGAGLFAIILFFQVLSFVATTRKYEKVREVITDVNGNVTDRVATVRLIKASGTENYETEKFKQEHVKYYEISKPIGHLSATMLTTVFVGAAIISFTTPVFAALFYGLGGDSDATLRFFQTTFAAYSLAQGLMIGPLFNILNSSFSLALANVSTSRIMHTLDSNSILEPHYWDGKVVTDIKGPIIFKDVEFEYPEKPGKVILPKFSFTFEEGKSYAFVGETGSGKSTIAKLLLRFYDPTKGEILINDSVNLKDVNLSSYLNHVGYVEQDPQILYGNVYENVKYGSFNATNEEVIEACKKAELHDLIMTWPEGYDTILGERGFMLSGGQKQRLIISRMFVKNPKILIFDEATSALDNIVEKEIQDKLNELMGGRTSVTIAHRLSTIKNVDEIIVLGGNGTGVVQQGTFNELKKTPGHFKRLYDAGLID